MNRQAACIRTMFFATIRDKTDRVDVNHVSDSHPLPRGQAGEQLRPLRPARRAGLDERDADHHLVAPTPPGSPVLGRPGYFFHRRRGVAAGTANLSARNPGRLGHTSPRRAWRCTYRTARRSMAASTSTRSRDYDRDRCPVRHGPHVSLDPARVHDATRKYSRRVLRVPSAI